MISKIKSSKASASIGGGISILVALALMFTGVRLYQIETEAASIQETSDASVLAAEAQVAKFYNVANTCDTAIVVMNAAQYVLWGTAIVFACAGNVATSADLIAKANGIGEARSSFSATAKKGLSVYQEALPLLSAVSALNVVQENELDSGNSLGIAVLVPQKGKEIKLDTSALEKAESKASSQVDEVQKEAEELQKLKEEMDKINREAWVLDCGAEPAYCLYERASSLSNISPTDNPHYSSPDAWDFNVAYRRSFAYFQSRKETEYPQALDDLRERSRSYLRKDYYEWCVSEFEDSLGNLGDSEQYVLPELYSEANSFRDSDRYNENIYPITESSGTRTMHSNPGMPCAAGFVSLGSCSQFDSEEFSECDVCEFSTSNVGSVASATTNTVSGFEHYYHQIRALKDSFDEAKKAFDEASRKMKETLNEANDALSSFLNEAKKARIKVSPPGRDGAVSLTVSKNGKSKSSVDNLFVRENDELGFTFAVSGAKLETDKAESGISMLMKRLEPKTDDNSAVARVWRNILNQFGEEKELSGNLLNVESCSGELSSELAGHAKKLLNDTLDGLGLSPSDWVAKKPVIRNTEKVIKGSRDDFATAFESAQSLARKSSSPSTNFMAAVSSLLNSEFDEEIKKAKFDVAVADLPVIGEVKVEVDFEKLLGEEGRARVKGVICELQDVQFGKNDIRSWK